MKKIIALLLTCVTAFAALVSGGCSGGLSAEDIKSSLIIEVHSAGYGTDWIDFMAKEYQKKTGKKVVVSYQVGAQGLTTMAANLESLTSDTDLFFMVRILPKFIEGKFKLVRKNILVFMKT